MKVLVWCPQSAVRYTADVLATAQAAILSEWSEVTLRIGCLGLLDLSQFDAAVVNGLAIPAGFPTRTAVYCFHPARRTRWGNASASMFRNLVGCCEKGATALCYDEAITRNLQSEGLPVEYSPIGYHPSFEVGPGRSFDSGIWFLGTLIPRRRTVLRACDARTFRNCYGECRDAMLRTAGVHLNFAGRQHARFFHGLRVIVHLVSNKRTVVSERSPSSPLVNGEHWIETDTNHMAEAALSLMGDRRAREEMAEAAYSFVSRNLQLRDTFGELLRRKWSA